MNKAERKLFCEIFPLCYEIAVIKGCIKNWPDLLAAHLEFADKCDDKRLSLDVTEKAFLLKFKSHHRILKIVKLLLQNKLPKCCSLIFSIFLSSPSSHGAEKIMKFTGKL